MAYKDAAFGDILQQNDIKQSRQGKKLLSALSDELESTISLKWARVETKILPQLVNLLNKGLLEICLTTWGKRKDLQQFRGSGKRFEVTLSTHNVISEHRPTLVIYLDGIPTHRMQIDVCVNLKLKGFRLSIQGGKIRQVSTGSCNGEVTIGYKGVQLKKKTRNIALPGKINLGDGISLSPEEKGVEAESVVALIS